MRFATIRTAAGTRAARIEGDVLVELVERDVGALLQAGPDAMARATGATGTEHPIAKADFAPVVTHPGKVICQGLNYRNHIVEMGHDLPRYPTLFAKFREALIGAHDDIVLPALSDRVDWEVELALVVGRPVRHANRDVAAQAIAGFTVANDISMRDWQGRSREWLQGKSWERSTPVGPWLVTPDEVGGPTPDLEVTCAVDGVERQRSRTSELVFDPVDLVAYASEFVTLEPGDLLLTGTPAGVGAAMTPPVFLRPGQVVQTRVVGVGELRNRCRPEVP
ncbi:MAG: fumarylacetoacetate hydrolase family protein [Acidimicrobiia bacterium]